MEDFTKEGFKTLVEAIRHSNALPTGLDWNFYNTSEFFNNYTINEGNNILRLMNSIMEHHDMENSIKNHILDDKIELVVEANDTILEKVANNIDELNGIKKATIEPVLLQTISAEVPTINGSWNRNKFSANDGQSGPARIKLITGKNIIRPQKFFKDKIDNSNNSPWQPRIKDKPNSIKPLAIFLEEYGNRQEYSHPYEFELERFQPLPEQLEATDKPPSIKPITETPLIEIQKPEQLDELVQALRGCTEFAIDVEHHSYRSFMGITCLLQISTRDKDYLIDTLVLRDHLWILNEVFTKPTIVKIFHGADMDIEWLQRDLSLYVVNMFDTHQAAKVLGYSSLSLAFLLRKFCDVIPNKQYQLADWRIRPLPDELKTYAREDSHYLIYIYNVLKKELKNKAHGSDNLIKAVFERSTEVCKKRYFKPILTDESHKEIYRRSRKLFDNRQLYALKELYTWRDLLARQEDESTGFVLPNHMLLQISEKLPREMQGILACCNPIPPLVKSHLLEIHHIILRARDQPIEKPILREDIRAPGNTIEMSKISLNNPLYCPFDLSKSGEFRDDLPTLLGKHLIIDSAVNKDLKEKLKFEDVPSVYSSFNLTLTKQIELVKRISISYLSPNERYKLVKPFVAEAEKQADEKEKQNLDKKEDDTKKVEFPKTDEQTTTDKSKNDSPKNEERTDEERIASVRDHFLKLNEQFKKDQEQKEKEKEEKEKRQNQKSLLEQGGSKKRKREPSFNELEEIANNVESNQYDSVPRVYVNGNRKRKNNNNNDEKIYPKKKQKKNNKSVNAQNQKPKSEKNKQKKMNQKKNRQNRQNTNNQSNVYASVDFGQFQGGAKGSTVPKKFRSKFKNKGKGKQNTNNTGVRTATFPVIKKQH